MGTYINPSDGSSKESFLEKHGKKISDSDFKTKDFGDLLAQGKLAVGWVDNGGFTAAVVCDTKRELEHVQGMRDDGSDQRPFQAHLVPVDVLYEFIPEHTVESLKVVMQGVESAT